MYPPALKLEQQQQQQKKKVEEDITFTQFVIGFFGEEVKEQINQVDIELLHRYQLISSGINLI